MDVKLLSKSLAHANNIASIASPNGGVFVLYSLQARAPKSYNILTNMDNEKTLLVSFATEEHKHYNRSIDFYWTIGIIGVVVAVLAFIFKDALFGVLVLIGFGLYGYSSWKRPGIVNVFITNKDITIGDDNYPLSKITAFRVMDIKGDKELVLQINRSYQPIVSICVPDNLAYSVKDTLAAMLFEEETLVPHIGRRFMARYKI